MIMTLQLQVLQLFAQPSLIFKPFLIQEVIFESTDNSSFFNLNNLIIFVLGISIIANVIFVIMVKNRNRELKRIQYKPKSNGVDLLEYSKLKGENKQLNHQLISLQNQISNANLQKVTNISETDFNQQSISDYSRQKQSSIDSSIDRNEEIANTIDLVIKKQEEIFLPSPFEDMRFTIEDVSKEKTNSSLYKIVLNENGVTGKLLLLEDADFTRALNSPDHYLEKACTYENAFNPKAKGIDVVKTGSVKLENQDWFVTEKIKIKFI
jgi:hypothetical protein